MKRQLLPWVVVAIMVWGGTIPAWAEDKVKVTGDRIRGDTEKKILYITGNVRIVQGSDVITTDAATVDLDQKLLFLEGTVTFTNGDDLVVSADNLDYNMKKKNGTFKNNVLVQRLEKKTKGKDGNGKDPFTLYTDELYFESNTKNFTAKAGRIIHKDFTGTADVIEYNDRLQLLTLRGNAHLKKPEGEELHGDVTQINLEKKTFVVENNVMIHFDVDDDDEAENGKASTEPSAEQADQAPAESGDGPDVEIVPEEPLPELKDEVQSDNEQKASA